MNKPATAQELIDKIEKWQKYDFLHDYVARVEAQLILAACKAYLDATK